jgi:hypothetical protein
VDWGVSLFSLPLLTYFFLLGFDIKIQGIFIASGFSGDHSRSMTGNGKGFGVLVHSFIVG